MRYGRAALDLDRDDVRERVHARVRPSGDRRARRSEPESSAERPSQLSLDRPGAGLPRPAPKPGPVVLELSSFNARPVRHPPTAVL